MKETKVGTFKKKYEENLDYFNGNPNFQYLNLLKNIWVIQKNQHFCSC